MGRGGSCRHVQAVVNFSLILKEHWARNCTRLSLLEVWCLCLPLMSVIHWLPSVPLKKWRRAHSISHSSGTSWKWRVALSQHLGVSSLHSRAMNVMLTRVLGLSPSIDTDYRPDRKSRRGFIGTPAAAIGSKNKQPVPSLACSLGGGRLIPSYLAWGQERVRGLGWRDGLGSFAHCSGDIDYRRAYAVPCFYCQHPVFAPGSSKAAVGLFLVFLYLLVQDLPQLQHALLFLVPHSFFVFCCSWRCVSSFKQCSKGS